MLHFTYITGLLTRTNIRGKAFKIAQHFTEGGYRHANVVIKNGGELYIQHDGNLCKLEACWNGAMLERCYFSIEAALLDGLNFATDFQNFTNPEPYSNSDKEHDKCAYLIASTTKEGENDCKNFQTR